MSNPANPRLFRLLGDLIGVAAGVILVLTSLAHPAIDTTGVGIGLATVAGTHLEEDLNLSGT